MTQLRRPLLAFAALAVAYVALSVAVASGLLAAADRTVYDAVTAVAQPALIPLARGVAVLGGADVTAVVAAALFVWMTRQRLSPERWAVLALPVLVALETVYKQIVHHPPPPIRHLDGPTLIQLLGPIQRAANAGGSFPSGHAARAVLVYGLLAFVVARFSERRWAGRLAVAVAVAVCIAVSVTRVYLGVHWESDVVGGVLLGGLALTGAVIWLDRPL